MKRIGKTFFIFIMLITISINSVFAAEYRKTPDDIVDLIMDSGSEDFSTRIYNKTTVEEVTKDYAKITDIMDAVSSGYTPKITVKIGLNDERTQTIFWDITVKHTKMSELDDDERIIKELEIINTKKTFKEKVTEIDRYVKEVCSYDKEYDNGETKNRISETALGALNGKAICQGYSNLASYLYERAGIENIKVRGVDRFSKVRHVWNVVRDENGKMYVVDTTWNDATSRFLLVSLEQYELNTVDEFDEEELFNLKYPETIEIEQSVQAYPLNAYSEEESRFYSRISTILKYI